VLGLRVAKSASYTRWDVRPLSGEQIEYAREDVVHLLELADELAERLAAQGRLGWARQECESLEQSSDVRDLEVVLSRLPRVRNLRPESQAVARELVEWRERTAAAQDRPVATVLNDSALVEVAKRRPGSLRELEQIRGVNQGSLRRRGDDVLAAVRRGRERVPRGWTTASARHPGGRRRRARGLGRGAAALARTGAGLAYELVASRADLQAIVTAWRGGGSEPDVRALRGWRRELVGAELLELLAGALSLSVDAERRVRVTR